MFRLYDMNNFTNSTQSTPITTTQPSITMGRSLLLSSSPLPSSPSPSTLLFFQKPMIANVSQAKSGCGSCGGTR